MEDELYHEYVVSSKVNGKYAIAGRDISEEHCPPAGDAHHQSLNTDSHVASDIW